MGRIETVNENQISKPPWRVGGQGHGKFSGTIIADTEDGDYVAEVIERINWRANADLIAAAPELMDLAYGVITAFGDKVIRTPEEEHLLNGAHRALTKVTGGEVTQR